MKIALLLTRILVGLLFIFSGLIKANDPLGLSYKMQEFFDLWKMSGLNSYSLAFSVLIIAFEIIAGVALIIGWKPRLMSWLVLLLIVFFTFLTGYAHLSGKFKNCGCFGDCIPITAKTSFIKDIILLALVLFLFAMRNRMMPLFSARINNIIMALTVLFSAFIQWYTLNYLPVFDCLPYKKGNNLREQMKIPANAIPDSTVITYLYEKDGKRVEFTTENFPADFSSTTYKYISRNDKIVRKGKNNEPPIKGFRLTAEDGSDHTDTVLSAPRAVLYFVDGFAKPQSNWQKDFVELHNASLKSQTPVFLITGNRAMVANEISKSAPGVPVYSCDVTAIHTAARTNPCIIFLENGTVTGKFSHRETDKAISFLNKGGN